MKVNRFGYLILLLSYVCMSSPAFFDAAEAYTLQTEHEFPWTAYFRSLYARTHLASGKFPIKAVFEGYILYEPFWDSRQIDAAINGLVLFAPKRQDIGTNGEDINATGEFAMSVLETRWRIKLYGPEIWGAELFGLIETDFIDSGALLTRMRSRLAYFKLTWKEQNASLLIGQFYHPIRLAHLDLDPKVISHNRGSPLHPDVRSPQIKFTKHWPNNLNILIAAISQHIPRSLGVEGPSTQYFRRSLTPMMDVQLWWGPLDTQYICGVGFDIKRLMPRLVTPECFRTRETITSVAFNAFAKITAEPLSVRTQFVWAQNGSDYDYLGGYAVSSIDPITGKQTYTNTRALSYWIDFNLDKKVSPGLFSGFTKNLGSGSPIVPTVNSGFIKDLNFDIPIILTINSETEECGPFVFARGQDIKYMTKFVPRIRFHFKPVVFGAELEWTRAGYGTVTTSGQIENVEPVSNIRLILASYFFF